MYFPKLRDKCGEKGVKESVLLLSRNNTNLNNEFKLQQYLSSQDLAPMVYVTQNFLTNDLNISNNLVKQIALDRKSEKKIVCINS